MAIGIETSGGRVIYSLVRNCLLYVALIATFILVSFARGQETCSEEVKVLLSPTEVQAAIPALRHVEKGMVGSIFMTRRGLICSRRV